MSKFLRSKRILKLLPVTDENYVSPKRCKKKDSPKKGCKNSSPVPGDPDEIIQLEDLIGAEAFANHDIDTSQPPDVPIDPLQEPECISNVQQEIVSEIAFSSVLNVSIPATNNIDTSQPPTTFDLVPEPRRITNDHQNILSTISTSPVLNASTSATNVEQNNLVIQNDTTPIPSPSRSHGGFCACCNENEMVTLNHDEIYGNLPTPSVTSMSTVGGTPTISKKNRKKTFKTDNGRKRLVHIDKWEKTQRKIFKNQGKSHKNSRGKEVEEKLLKGPCTDKCRMKCSEKINNDRRQKIFKIFWSLGSRENQWRFVVKYTKMIPKLRRTVHENIKHNRQNTYFYSLPTENGDIKVCKTMFLNTISSGERIVSTAWKKYDPESATVEEDRRGKYDHEKRVITTEMIRNVCDHVRAFKPVESHYTRKDSKKLYLEGIKSIGQMFRLYKEWFDPNKYEDKAEKKRQYRDIVNANFNLGFFKPKKDRCDVCHIYENKVIPTDEEKEIYIVHQQHKITARRLKQEDKDKSKADASILTAVFDFEKVLLTPFGEVSVFYYKRKLPTLNFTVYNMANHEAICYMWHDGIAKRGSNEVASCLYQFIRENVERGVKEFRFWSDNCAGQNRNRIVFSLYLLAAKEHGVTITHRFMEKGHTQNEGDSVHSTIETAAKGKLIYTPDEWFCHVRWARTEGTPYHVKEVKTSDILNFKAFLANRNWTKTTTNEKVQWTKVREVRVFKDNFDRIEFKYDLNEAAKTIIILRSGTRSNQSARFVRDFEVKCAYDSLLPITYEKHKDLLNLCQSGVIPDKYHSFYRSLPYLDRASRQTQDDTDPGEDEE